MAISASLRSDSSLFAGDWMRFRGPNGTGSYEDEKPLPVTWGETENLAWKRPLPGPGVSSPIVVGEKVFVTCYSGYGVERDDPGNMDDLKRHLVCLNRKSGEIVWQKTIDAVLPEDPYSGPGVPTHGYASHSPVSDGKNVYVFFGKTGALAFDLEGKQLWQTNVGQESDPRRWGSSSSPILYEDKLILTASAESEALVALDTKTGKEVWRAEASGLANTWGTPTLGKTESGETQIVLGVPYEIWGLNPETGKLQWYCEAMDTDQFNSSVINADGLIIGIEGRSGGAVAVRPGGKGDITDSNRVWQERHSGRFSTPVYYDGRVYGISNGIVTCIDAKTGERIYQARLEGNSQQEQSQDRAEEGGQRRGFGFGRGRFGGSDYSSPILADGKIYFVRGTGEVFVIKAGDEFEQLAVNQMPASGEQFMATPAASDGQLFIRSDKHLYCIGRTD
ncbi:MAG: PQQ-binding-like beta-propeller repeat protein [Planctomycetaceae bacterium]|nr:PQQ-binding-like beta-propeller repeat protein [Planctomycetaceae bacterium]